MGVLNNTGYQTKTFAEYKLLFQGYFQTAFGVLIDLSETSPQGNLVNSMSEWAENADKIGLDVFRSMNINTASGVSLDFIALLRRTVRKSGTHAVIDCQFTSSTIPYNLVSGEKFTLSNDSSVEFELTANIAISTNPQTVQLVAIKAGDLNIETGDKLETVNFINELEDIEILTYANGTDTETDDELRRRLQETNGENATATVESIYNGLITLEDVSKANVLENATGAVDGLGLPAHSIEAIVLGDTDINVAEAIFIRNPAGTVMYGLTSVVVQDIMLNNHTINFTRPLLRDCHVRVTVQKKEFQSAVDTIYFNQMKEEIVEYVDGARIGEDVSHSTVYGIFAKYNSFDINQLDLSYDGVSWIQTNLSILEREYSDTEIAKIEIVVV